MKCHTGVDAGSGFVHTVEATAANVHDVTVAAKLLREDDEVVYGDSAYLGLEKRDEIKHNPRFSSIKFRINRRPGSLPRVSDNAIDWERYIENRKSSVRCKVEHPFRIVKNIFGFRKTVYRGLRKILTDCTCSLPAQTCICLPGRAVHYAPPEIFAPFGLE
jgi:IS5 family transposase